MRFGLTKKNPNKERSLIVELSNKEEKEIWDAFVKHVMEDKLRMRSGHFRRHFDKPSGIARWKIPATYAEAMVNTFPYAIQSRAVRKYVGVENEEVLDLPVPKLKIPGFKAMPGFKEKLYDYQKIAVQKLIDNPKYLETDDFGLGKSHIALAATQYLKAYPTLIICPNNAKFVWERFIRLRIPKATVSVVIGNAAERRAAIHAGADFTIINWEALRLHVETDEEKEPGDLQQILWEQVIADEFHRAKSPTAQVTEAFHALRARRWVPMSSTPILNRVEESWSALHRCWPKHFPSFWLFDRRYVVRGGYGGGKAVAYLNLPELREFIEKKSIRRRRDQVLKELPEVVHNVRLVELTKEQRKLYNKIEKELMLELENGEVKNIISFLSKITRLQQACFSPELYGGSKISAKVEELKEIVRELVDNGEKAIIFTKWSKAARIIERELAEYNPAFVDGSVKDTKKRQRRMEQQDRFNEDPNCHVYIGTIRSNMEAITLSAATYVIFTDKDWAPMANDQAIGRSAAGGLRGLNAKVNKVHVIDLFAVDTIEERIEERLAEKRAIFNALFESDGGLEIPKKELKNLFELFQEDIEERQAA